MNANIENGMVISAAEAAPAIRPGAWYEAQARIAWLQHEVAVLRHPEAIAHSMRKLGYVNHEHGSKLIEALHDLMARQTWGDHSDVADALADAMSAHADVYADPEEVT